MKDMEKLKSYLYNKIALFHSKILIKSVRDRLDEIENAILQGNNWQRAFGRL